MGKRVEKAFGRDKGQASNASNDNAEDDPNRTPEPYICTGQFHTDFQEMCRRNSMVVIPGVVLRAHRPPSPSLAPPAEEKTKAGRKDDKKNQPPPEPEPEPEVDENGEAIEPPPKTYVTKDKFEYFKPCVQVEMDNPDKQDTVTEIYVRGWKIDDAMMKVFKSCLLKLDRLHTINFWSTGLTDSTLEVLAMFIPELPNLRQMVLDNNPVSGEGFSLLIREDSPLHHLSLRYNGITDRGAEELGRLLGSPTRSNQKLLSLNLNGNRITDKGLAFIAEGLRMNRTLLSLGLSNNKISDEGAKKISEVLSWFPLTHEEIVERRKLMSEKGSPERQKSAPPGSRRADSRDRPNSVRSSHAGQSKGGKSAKNKKESKGKEEEKAKGKKEQDKNPKKGSVVAETGKAATKKGEKTKGKGKGPSVPENEKIRYLNSLLASLYNPIVNPAMTSSEPDALEVMNPLLDTVEHLDNGVVMLVGNRSLINLNLSHNRITEEGVKALLSAVGYQTSITQFQSQAKTGNIGLMRLGLNKNRIAADNETLKKLLDMMETKDPFYKPPPSPDQESIAQSQ